MYDSEFDVEIDEELLQEMFQKIRTWEFSNIKTQKYDDKKAVDEISKYLKRKMQERS